MAELGTINYTDNNSGTSRVDRSAESRALDSALGVAEKAINEGVKASVTRDFNEAIDEARTAADAPAVNPVPETERNITDPKQAELARNLDRWKQQSKQGNSSQRAMAELRIKEILNEAQARYPWMVEDLQARAGLVVAGSHELEELGMLDAAANAATSSARSQLDDVFDYATKPWDQNGLGIPPSIPMGSQRWLAEYVWRNELREAETMNSMVIGMTASNREVDALGMREAVHATLQGATSSAMAANFGALESNGFYAALGEAVKGEGANLEVLQQFQTTGIPMIISELEASKLEVTQLYDQQFRTRLAGTTVGEEAKARVDDYIAEIDSMIAKFNQSADALPDALQQIDAFMGVRSANVFRSLQEPHKQFVSFVSGPGKNLIELVKLDHTAQGLVTQEKIGAMSTSILVSTYPDKIGPNATEGNNQARLFLTSGQGQINSTAAPSDVNRLLDKGQRDSNKPWYVPTNNDTEENLAALDAYDLHTKVWSNALATPENTTPEMAALYLTGANNSIRGFLSQEERPEDLEEIVRSGLADDRLLKAIETVGDNPAVKNQRRAFGASAKEWYERTDPRSRREQALATYNNDTIDQIPLQSLVLIDIDRMSDEGVFAYQIDSAALARAVDNRVARQDEAAQREDIPFSGVSRARAREAITNEIFEKMDPIANEVNESITINRNLDAATAATADSRRASDVKLQWFDQLGWLDGFNTNATN